MSHLRKRKRQSVVFSSFFFMFLQKFFSVYFNLIFIKGHCPSMYIIIYYKAMCMSCPHTHYIILIFVVIVVVVVVVYRQINSI